MCKLLLSDFLNFFSSAIRWGRSAKQHFEKQGALCANDETEGVFERYYAIRRIDQFAFLPAYGAGVEIYGTSRLCRISHGGGLLRKSRKST